MNSSLLVAVTVDVFCSLKGVVQWLLIGLQVGAFAAIVFPCFWFVGLSFWAK